MRILYCLVGVAMVAAPSVLAQDIGGAYLVAGTNFDGSAYEGEAYVSLTSEVTCEIEWHTAGVESQGICMRSGNVFTAAYSLDGQIGLAIYQVMPDGSLEGTWTIANESGIGVEVLVPD